MKGSPKSASATAGLVLVSLSDLFILASKTSFRETQLEVCSLGSPPYAESLSSMD